MDIQHLVDRLEELLSDGRHIPFSAQTLVDEQRALELIDQMRISPDSSDDANRPESVSVSVIQATLAGCSPRRRGDASRLSRGSR